MADLITVEDPDDPRLRDYTGLTDVELRRKREPAEGLFIAEGEKVIRRAKDAGYEMRSMLLSAKWVDVMRDVIDELPAPVYAVSPELAEQVTGYHVHRGALASMQRKPLPDGGRTAATARAGSWSWRRSTTTPTSARSSAAPPPSAWTRCCSPRTARTRSTAARSRSRWARSSPCRTPASTAWPGGLETVREAGFTLLALTPDEKASRLDEAAPHRMDRVALMLGAEGDGLSTQALVAADEWVRIPMAHGVDSLNVGAAAAVAFYAVATGRPEGLNRARGATAPTGAARARAPDRRTVRGCSLALRGPRRPRARGGPDSPARPRSPAPPAASPPRTRTAAAAAAADWRAAARSPVRTRPGRPVPLRGPGRFPVRVVFRAAADRPRRRTARTAPPPRDAGRCRARDAGPEDAAVPGTATRVAPASGRAGGPLVRVAARRAGPSAGPPRPHAARAAVRPPKPCASRAAISLSRNDSWSVLGRSSGSFARHARTSGASASGTPVQLRLLVHHPVQHDLGTAVPEGRVGRSPRTRAWRRGRTRPWPG